jgi:hypothetical protein
VALLLIALAVAAAVLLYAFATGLVGNLTRGGPSSLVTGSGEMIVPGSSDLTAIMSLNLRNGGSQKINSISVSCSSPPFVTSACTLALPSPQLVFDYSGLPISALNPLPVNALGTASAVVSVAVGSVFAAGTTYTVLVAVGFVGGSIQDVAISVSSTA